MDLSSFVDANGVAERICGNTKRTPHNATSPVILSTWHTEMETMVALPEWCRAHHVVGVNVPQLMKC